MRYLFILLTSLFVVVVNPVAGQDESKALVSFHNGVVLTGVDNRFRVVIQQQEQVSLDQLSAVLLPHGDEAKSDPVPLEVSQNSYGFVLHPRETGTVSITIVLKDETKEYYNFNAIPTIGVSRVGGWDARYTVSVPAMAFKHQKGVYTQVEGSDICAACITTSYEIIRITPGQKAEIIFNTGSNYEAEAAKLISTAQPGDRYIFTKIRYRCPGAQSDQFGETLSFELR